MHLLLIIYGILMGFGPHSVQDNPGFDLEATEVICHKTEKGERYFSYVISNVGENTAEEGSYSVYFVVNGKMISFDRETSSIEPGKSVKYTSEHKFDQKKKGKRLRYKLIINTEDANKDNNKKKGVA